MKKIWLWIFLTIAFFPFKAFAFDVGFCFPLSLTLLMSILGWPSMILYGIFGIYLAGFFSIFAIGIIIDSLLLYALGIILDRNRKKRGDLHKNYRLRLPIIFIILILILWGLIFIDPTCWKSL